jgi:hypothetical protein
VGKHGSLEALSDLRAARVSGRLQQRADKRRREQAAQEQAEALRVRLEMEAAAAARDAAAAADGAARREPVGESAHPIAHLVGCTLAQLLGREPVTHATLAVLPSDAGVAAGHAVCSVMHSPAAPLAAVADADTAAVPSVPAMLPQRRWWTRIPASACAAMALMQPWLKWRSCEGGAAPQAGWQLQLLTGVLLDSHSLEGSHAEVAYRINHHVGVVCDRRYTSMRNCADYISKPLHIKHIAQMRRARVAASLTLVPPGARFCRPVRSAAMQLIGCGALLLPTVNLSTVSLLRVAARAHRCDLFRTCVLLLFSMRARFQ